MSSVSAGSPPPGKAELASRCRECYRDGMLLVRQDIGRLQPITAPSGVERVRVEFTSGAQVVARVEAPMLGGFSTGDVMRLALDAMGPVELLRAAGLMRRPLFWLKAAATVARLAPRARSLGEAVKTALGEAAVAMAGSPERTIASLVADGRSMAVRTAPAAVEQTAAHETPDETQRLESRASGRANHIPILLYHRIADDGPAGLARYRQSPAAFADQMRWLRDNGYHAVTSADVLDHLSRGRAFEGRPVMISFDDAYCDFHDTAWPILHAHGFTAEIFVVTDKVGGLADWDVAYGTPAELMDWPTIQSLSAAGVRFGSHMASHSHMAELSSREIVLEAARSRAALGRALGTPCDSIAAPFGEGDGRFVRIARECGYKTGFTTDPGRAEFGHDAMRLPRIEVLGGWSLAAFSEAIGQG